jgi:hypothetical protein
MILAVVLIGLAFAFSAHAGVNYIENMKQYQADKETAPAPMPTKEGSQFWHRSRYLREQEPITGTEVQTSTTEHQNQKYDRPNWAK